MCESYVSPDEAEIKRHFGIQARSPYPHTRRSIAAPPDTVPILVLAVDEGYTLSVARWGLIPQWWKQDRAPDHTFNARSEEAASKSIWRQAYRHSRCLIPAEGWFEPVEREWIDLDTQEAHKAIEPHFVRSQPDSVIAFAGLMAGWRNAEGEHVLSCAVLTKANTGLANYRVPVVIAPNRYEEWLSPASTAALERIIAEARIDFVSYPVDAPDEQTRSESPAPQRLLKAA